MNRMIDLCLEIIAETEAAFKVTDGFVTNWIPKSQVELQGCCEPGDTVVFDMPEWLAEDKGFI